jgi:hypothetical protein
MARILFPLLALYGVLIPFCPFLALKAGQDSVEGGIRPDLDLVIRQSVVSIHGPSGSGTGVVIGRSGTLYTVLTAKHVVGGKADQTDVDLRDGSAGSQLYTIKEFPGVDLVVATFSSGKTFVPAVINNFLPYPAPATAELSVPQLNLRSRFNTVTNKARVAGYSLPSKAIKQRLFRVVDAQLIEQIKGNEDGYNLIYQSSTVQGMSGGPVIGFRDCSNGRGFGLGISPNSVFPTLVGIHGRSEDYRGGDGRSGVSLGIPIDRELLMFLESISPKHGVPIGEAQIRPLVNRFYCL